MIRAKIVIQRINWLSEKLAKRATLLGNGFQSLEPKSLKHQSIANKYLQYFVHKKWFPVLEKSRIERQMSMVVSVKCPFEMLEWGTRSHITFAVFDIFSLGNAQRKTE